jgi:hypothetical protein
MISLLYIIKKFWSKKQKVSHTSPLFPNPTYILSQEPVCVRTPNGKAPFGQEPVCVRTPNGKAPFGQEPLCVRVPAVKNPLGQEVKVLRCQAAPGLGQWFLGSGSLMSRVFEYKGLQGLYSLTTIK